MAIFYAKAKLDNLFTHFFGSTFYCLLVYHISENTIHVTCFFPLDFSHNFTHVKLTRVNYAKDYSCVNINN